MARKRKHQMCNIPNLTSVKSDQNSKKKRSKFKHLVTIYDSNDFSYNFQDLASSYPPFDQQLEQLKLRRKNFKRKFPNSSEQHRTAETNDKLNLSFGTFVTFEFNAELTRAILLKHHNGLVLPSIPEGYLCPPIPNRLNYVRWIRDLIFDEECIDPDPEDSKSTQLHFQGIDIGTGATCIYPLLLSSVLSDQLKKWTFFATDVDQKSICSAQKNVDANKLHDQIKLALVNQTLAEPKSVDTSRSNTNSGNPYPYVNGPVLNAIQAVSKLPKKENTSSSTQFDFCMTNPPFYSTAEQCREIRAGDCRARTSMTLSESLYPRGGEVAFIVDMIHDSLTSRQQIKWYSSLIGQKSTLDHVEQILVDLGFTKGNVRVAEFVQGQRRSQRRWGIAWTFTEIPMRSLATTILHDVETFQVTEWSNIGKSCERNSIEKKSSDIIQTNTTKTINAEAPISNADWKSRRNAFRSEVVQRINEYCSFIQKNMTWKLKTTVSQNDESSENTLITIVEELPSPIDYIINSKEQVKTRQLPLTMSSNVTAQESSFVHARNRHFLVDVLVESSLRSSEMLIVNVSIHSYCHTRRGESIVGKIRSQIKGDVQRSNRRWRRALKKDLIKSSIDLIN